jgi:hypothetical protein
MRKPARLTIAAIAVGLLAFAALAQAERPTTIRVGNLELAINGEVSPTALSATKLTPVSLRVQGHIGTVDGSQPPPLTEAVIDSDRNGTIDTRGVPTCSRKELGATTTAQAEAACRPAIVGRGSSDVQVAFAEGAPIPIHSTLLALNGGTVRGVTTIYVHTYLSSPVSAAIISTVTLQKKRSGPYGIHSVVDFPEIAAGAGSVTDFDLTFNRRLFPYRGARHGYLLAKCPSGTVSFFAQAEAKFANGDRIGPASIQRACTPKD